MNNEFSYSGVETQLNNVKKACEQIEQDFKTIDNVMMSSVGPGGTAWSGNAANNYTKSWEDLQAEIPEFITKSILKIVDFISVRDEKSLNLLKSWKINSILVVYLFFLYIEKSRLFVAFF